MAGVDLGYRDRVIALSRLFSYPVKSCRGIEHDTVALTSAGLEHDREWMFVTADGRFLTQREEPRLALVEVALTDRELHLSARGAGPLVVPLDRNGPLRGVTVWRDRVNAQDEGDGPAAWISSLLGREARLVRFDRDAHRPSARDWTGEIEALNRFSDGFPLLALSRASLDDLNARLPVALPMNRFRPNLVLDGLPPYGEDQLHELVSGAIRLRIVKPCTRCIVTTTAQDSGTIDGDEPLRTLKTYRWNERLRGAAFGQNTIVVSGAGEPLSVGMRFEATYR